ncbi:MAG TPA: chromate transporter [Micropepsaceae bacterium]|jgi:chromate transporter|nr:chromate transporter [Micropepsaceae bacterium]
MSETRLFALILVFAPLSLLSFGGGQAIVADMQHQVVDVRHWLTGPQFADLFALSRAAPGPSTLIAALIGWQVAGFLGAVIATLAIYIPSSFVVYGAVRWWHASKDSPWRGAFERGLTPVALGLVFAGAWAVLQAAHVNAFQILTTMVVAGLLIFTRVGIYLIMAVTAAIYGLLQFL